jgi:hypothetical protein
MFQSELMRITNMSMQQAVRTRDQQEAGCDEYWYWHGRFNAYEEMVKLLMMNDIEQQDPSMALTN